MSEKKIKNPPKETLSPRQELFCREYLIDLSGRKAVIRAGYSTSSDSAETQSCRLLNNVRIRRRIEELSGKQSALLGLTAELVLRELANIAKADIGDAFNEKGELLHPQAMPEDIRKAVSSFECLEQFEMNYDDGKPRREMTGYLKKVRLNDKIKALDLLGKHLKLFTDKIEHSGKVTLEELVMGSMKKDES